VIYNQFEGPQSFPFKYGFLAKKPPMDCCTVGVAISSRGGGMFNLLACCCDPSRHASIFPLEHVEVPALEPNPKDDSVTRCSHRLYCLCFSLFECNFSALSPMLEMSIIQSDYWHNVFCLSAFNALTQPLYRGSCSPFLLYRHWPFRPLDSMTLQNSLCTPLCMRWLPRPIRNGRGYRLLQYLIPGRHGS